ncbi:MAG: site-2 protease family protein [Isosphaeraceae bacterium]
MIGSADHTAYDLRFRLLDIPVRVNPWFWLVMLIFSGEYSGPQVSKLTASLAFLACGFVSLLAHEFGHALSSRLVGVEPTEVVLYGMGGYCAFGGWHRGRRERAFVIFCGPAAGFLLFFTVLLGAVSAWNASPLDLFRLIGVGNGTDDFPLVVRRMLQNELAGIVVWRLLLINFWWGVLNLIPIWPLDGGRLAEVGLGAVNPRDGQRWTHTISLVCAGGLALWYASSEEYWMAVWFGYFGYINYKILESFRSPFRMSDGWR